MPAAELYNYPKRLESALDKLKNEKICKQNKDEILSFSKVKLAKGSTSGRVAKVVYCLRCLAKWLNKPFRQATKDDLIALVGDIESNAHYSKHTKYDFKVVLKMYYKWLEGDDENFPPKITWLKKDMKSDRHKLPEELLTEDEILKMANSAENLRDKAFVLVLYESGCRIGEIASARLKNVAFDKNGAVIRVDGKTGCRRVRVISSASVLASWINSHPYSDNPDSVLWPPMATNKRNPEKCINHRSFYCLIRQLAHNAGIKKRVYPHLFRHSRATALANKLTEAQMKEYFGWVQGSDMAATYVHLSGRDVDNALLKMHGLAHDEDQQEDKMKVRACQRCKEHNSPISKFCTRCDLPLDEKFMSRIETERENADGLMNRLMEDKEFKEFMLKKVLEMEIGNKKLDLSE